MKDKYIRRILLICTSLFAMVRLAFGYIDPNTGGLVFQLLAVILASLTGILLFFYRHIQMFVAKVRRAMRSGSSKAASPGAIAEADESE